jgi:hypothetical protein
VLIVVSDVAGSINPTIIGESEMAVKLQPVEPPEDAAQEVHRGADARATPPHLRERTVALVIFALALALYLRTGARGLLPGDPGEFQMAAWTFGLAHASGYPLYLITGGLWQHFWALLGASPAAALNALSAVQGAAAVALFYLLAVQGIPGSVAIRRMGSLLAAFFLATNPTFWSQGLIAEVYALQALLLVSIFLIFQGITRSEAGKANPLWLALLVGLALTHHATTLLWLPGLAVGLWLVRDRLSPRPVVWVAAAVALLGPLLLYFYVPLRATPAASPWYFPQLGSETLALYTHSLRGFRDFITGRTISVGYYDIGRAWENIGAAAHLWRLHFGYPGLVLAAIGVYSLAANRRYALLAITALGLLLQQIFNLFYAIEDILVYYIPIYVVLSLWAGWGGAQLAGGFAQMGASSDASTKKAQEPGAPAINWDVLGVIVGLVLLYFPMRQMVTYLPRLDQSGAVQARQMWEGILAAEPPANAVLVSNDRNEIVPFYYLQKVEGARPDLTGIFPLIAPEPRFGNVAATVQTALDATPAAPVYLVKPMPGLEARFELAPATPPLVEVIGPVEGKPRFVVNQPFGPLTLRGFDWVRHGETVNLRLVWQLDGPLPAGYTTTVQLFDATSTRIAQNDAAAGGVYYPTTLWKPGEVLVEDHTLALSPGDEPATLLVGMYTGPEMTPLAPALMIDLGGFALN